MAPYVVAQTSATNTAADFVALSGTASPYSVAVATYTGVLPVSGGLKGGVYQATTNTTLTANEAVYALKVLPGMDVNATGYTLTLGGTSGQAGLILNGSNAGILGGTLAFGTQEGVIYSGGGSSSSITSAITGSGGVTIFGPSPLILSGANTYTGGTNIDGTVSVASDVFGAGSGNLAFNGGTLLTTAGFTSSRNVAVGLGGGTLTAASGTTLALAARSPAPAR